MISLPSKRAQSIIVILVGIVVGTILIFGQNTVKSGVKSLNTLVVGEKVALPENPNWQEDLGKIAPSTLSTDISLKTATSSPNVETITDSISRSLMANYLSLKQQGDLSATNKQTLIDQTIGYVESVGVQKAEISSLTIIADNGSTTVKSYGDRLGAIILVNKPPSVQNELKLLEDAVSTRNPKKIKELEEIALIYMQIANDLKKMPVPSTFQKSHIDIVNGLLGMSVSLSQMSKVFEDPVKGLAAMQAYKESGNLFKSAMSATSAYLKKNNIPYKQGSGGYYITHGI